MKQEFKFKFRGRNIIIEVGELSKQANGSVLVRYDDTVVLSNSVISKNQTTMDFFPLMILYQEKQYAAGKIPGGFIKREGRPTDSATLTARLIDRPIRPLFPEGFRNEVQVVNMVLSVDPEVAPDMTALFASSLSLSISDIPFSGPVAGVVVGRVDKEFIINPTPEQLEKSDINLSVAGTYEAINMVEAGAKEVSEKDMLKAIMFGHEAIKELIEIERKVIKKVGKEKLEFEIVEIDSKLEKEVDNYSKKDMVNAIKIKEKLERYEAIENVKQTAINHFDEMYTDQEDYEYKMKQVKMIVDKQERDEVRRLITEDKVRPDGRKIDEIRPLNSQVDILPRTHGSALFTRGQTQCLSITTLGALGESQVLDGIDGVEGKRFMLHYNFPPFSVGETGRYGAPGRREIGHGALGERALLQVIPDEVEFPYAIRVVSEILESNGSTSQASICAGCMSLMAAGVPIKAPVAGIAMGLITKDDKYKKYTILTDIQGMEDHLGDMDFKVAGTKNGICALQMDIKILGINEKILKEALEQAKIGRMQILDNMMGAISEPRKELSKYAPKIKTIKINPSKIRDVIGKGGEMITKIIEDCGGVKIDIDDDGNVVVYHSDIDLINKAIATIEGIVREPVIGETYEVKVTQLENFGAFVELWPGCEGLIHVSQIANERINHPKDVLKVGDIVIAKATEIDKKGKLNLSIKALLKKEEKKEDTKIEKKEK